MRTDHEIPACLNPDCQKPLEGRRTNCHHCNSACRAAAYRARKGITTAAVSQAFDTARAALDQAEALVRRKP